VVRLVSADVRLMDAAIAGDDALALALGHGVATGWAGFREALQPTRDGLYADPGSAEWGTRFFVAGEPSELVGWGGFKGPPDDGTVELGYAIAPSRQGNGLATAATNAMLDEAFADPGVSSVVAHTLAQRSASTRVLEKAGFEFDGETVEDGMDVWRFRLARPGA
jgi:ribosomal-protein-alanine N-acetyltransferase